MRGVEDGGTHQRPVNAAVRDGETAALHVGHGQLAVAGAQAHFGDLLLDGGKAHLVGVAQDWHHKAVGRAHRHAHVDIVLVDHVLTVDLGVDLGDLFQGVDAGFDEEGHEAQLDAVLFLELVLVGVAHLHDAGHVDLVVGRQHRGSVLRVLQAFGDGGAQAGHLDALFPGGIVSRDRRARDRDRSLRHDHRSGTAGGFGDIFLHDAAIAARASDLIRRQPGFGHRFPGGGGVFDVLGGRCRNGGRCRGGGCGFGRRCGPFDHDGEPGVGGDGGALGGEDLCQNTGHRAGNLDRDLVGFQFTQHLVLFHRIAGLFEPGRNGGFGDTFAQGGHHYVGHHLLLRPTRRSRGLLVRLCVWRRGPWRAKQSRGVRHSAGGWSWRRSWSRDAPVRVR